MITNDITGVNVIKDLMPYNWESKGINFASWLSQMDTFSNVGDGVWKSNFQNVWPYYYYSAGIHRYGTYCLGVFRSACNYLSFDFKARTDAPYINVVGGDYVSGQLSWSITAIPVLPEGFIDPNPASMFSCKVANYTTVTDLDWTASVCDVFTAYKNWVFYVTAYFMVFTNNPNYDKSHLFDNSEFQIRNIKTSPLSLVMVNPPIGKIVQTLDAGQLALSSPSFNYFLGRINQIPAVTMNIQAQAVANGVPHNIITSAATLELLANNPAYSWMVPLGNLVGAKIIYTLTLTGSNESPALDDIEIPISSFQSIIKQGGSTQAERDALLAEYNETIATIMAFWEEGNYYLTLEERQTAEAQALEDYNTRLAAMETTRPSYLSAVVPSSYKWAEEINQRQNGTMIIKKGYLMRDGTRNLEEIVRANFDYLMIDRGARNDSGSIIGYKVKTYSSPVTRRVQGVSYYGVDSEGKKRIRAVVDLFLRPRDICVYGDGEDDSFTVGQITYTVNAKAATMEVSEAD